MVGREDGWIAIKLIFYVQLGAHSTAAGGGEINEPANIMSYYNYYCNFISCATTVEQQCVCRLPRFPVIFPGMVCGG